MNLNFQNDENRNHNKIENQKYNTDINEIREIETSLEYYRETCERIDYISSRLKDLYSFINGLHKNDKDACRTRLIIKKLSTDFLNKKTAPEKFYEKLLFSSETYLNTDAYVFDDKSSVDSKFWTAISEKSGLSVYKCFSLWINRKKTNEPFSLEEDEAIYTAGQSKDCDWIDLSLFMSRTPLEIFRRYKFISQRIMNERSSWTTIEDIKLKESVELFGEGKWTEVSAYVTTKNPRQCLHRYKNRIQSGVTKGRWTKEEDSRLIEAVNKYGCKYWNKISEMVRTRNDSQCRERYMNVLNPLVKKCEWTKEEDNILLSMVDKYGDKKWTEICKNINGRTDAQCRRRYYLMVKGFESSYKNVSCSVNTYQQQVYQ